jgi:hypothetical protein
VHRRIHLLVDVENSTIEADEKRPARGERLVFIHDAVGGGNGFGRIAQQRVIESEFLRKRLVRFRRVDTDRKQRDVEAPDLFATLTE